MSSDRFESAHACIQEAGSIYPMSHVVSHMVDFSLSNVFQLAIISGLANIKMKSLTESSFKVMGGLFGAKIFSKSTLHGFNFNAGNTLAAWTTARSTGRSDGGEEVLRKFDRDQPRSHQEPSPTGMTIVSSQSRL